MASKLLPLGRHGRGEYHTLDSEYDQTLSGRASPAFGPAADDKDDSAMLLNKDTFLLTQTAKPIIKEPSESFRFSHRSQFMRIFWTSLLPRWLLSVVLCIFIAVHLWASQRFDMGGDGKQQWWFTAGLIALTALLGINIKSMGSQACRSIRWQILARRAYTKQELDAILATGNGWGATLRASWFRFRKIRLISFVISLIGLAVLVAAVLCVGSTGFLYSFESGGRGGVGSGKSLKADFKRIYNGAASAKANPSPSKEVQYLSAHLYGDMSYMNIDGLPQSPMWAGKPAVVPKADGSQQKQVWSYSFRETDSACSKWHTSGRSIESSAQCTHYPIVEGQQGDSASLTYLNGTAPTTLYNLQKFAAGASVWANARSDVSPWSFCGPRCARVFAFQYVDPAQDGTKAEGDMFDCYITVSAVIGGKPEDELPDDVAAIFAGSIGLRGFVTSQDKWQYTRYSRDMFWGEKFGDNTTAAASKVSRFTIGAIAMADVLGPRDDLTSQTSSEWHDIVLIVHWIRVFTVLPALLVLHLVIAITALSYANSVIIPPASSTIAIAKLLRPLENARTPIQGFTYGIQPSAQLGTASGEEGITPHRILIGGQSEVTARSRFPAGWYES